MDFQFIGLRIEVAIEPLVELKNCLHSLHAKGLRWFQTYKSLHGSGEKNKIKLIESPLNPCEGDQENAK